MAGGKSYVDAIIVGGSPIVAATLVTCTIAFGARVGISYVVTITVVDMNGSPVLAAIPVRIKLWNAFSGLIASVMEFSMVTGTGTQVLPLPGSDQQNEMIITTNASGVMTVTLSDPAGDTAVTLLLEACPVSVTGVPRTGGTAYTTFLLPG